ncbi:MAG: glycine cleavage system protein GcvH [Candidatus Lokiarchaeota archaeon]|nr:glycine cleavage system protein GcvH [Candidatus Lokiarchaeota archaeon]
MNFPNNLKYSKTHEWILKQDDNIALVGITDYAQHELGDIVFVEFEPAGENKSKGDTICNLESVKAVASVYMPVSGKIKEINPKLLEDEDFALVNNSPYENGWLIQIVMSNSDELSELMDSTTYQQFVEEAK